MGIVQINTDTAGQINVNPRRVKIITTDTLATVITAGYLNPTSLQGYTILPTDVIDMIYLYVPATNSGTYDVFIPAISNGVITLSLDSSGGNVLLPVVNNDFANFNGTTGQIKDSGYLPSNAALTRVVMQSAASVVNNIPKYADVTGTIIDSGTALTALQLSANIKAARTANIGGGGAGPISVVVAGVTAASIITGSIQASSNTVSVAKITATATGFDILFSGDPGATCTVNYVAFVVAQ